MEWRGENNSTIRILVCAWDLLLREVSRQRGLTGRVVRFSWSREADLITDPTLFLQNVVKLMRGLLQCMMRQVGGKRQMCLGVIGVGISSFSW